MKRRQTNENKNDKEEEETRIIAITGIPLNKPYVSSRKYHKWYCPYYGQYHLFNCHDQWCQHCIHHFYRNRQKVERNLKQLPSIKQTEYAMPGKVCFHADLRDPHLQEDWDKKHNTCAISRSEKQKVIFIPKKVTSRKSSCHVIRKDTFEPHRPIVVRYQEKPKMKQYHDMSSINNKELIPLSEKSPSTKVQLLIPLEEFKSEDFPKMTMKEEIVNTKDLIPKQEKIVFQENKVTIQENEKADVSHNSVILVGNEELSTEFLTNKEEYIEVFSADKNIPVIEDSTCETNPNLKEPASSKIAAASESSSEEEKEIISHQIQVVHPKYEQPHKPRVSSKNVEQEKVELSLHKGVAGRKIEDVTDKETKELLKSQKPIEIQERKDIGESITILKQKGRSDMMLPKQRNEVAIKVEDTSIRKAKEDRTKVPEMKEDYKRASTEYKSDIRKKSKHSKTNKWKEIIKAKIIHKHKHEEITPQLRNKLTGTALNKWKKIVFSNVSSKPETITPTSEYKVEFTGKPKRGAAEKLKQIIQSKIINKNRNTRIKDKMEITIRQKDSLARKWKKIVHSQIIPRYKSARVAPSPGTIKVSTRPEGTLLRKWKEVVQSQIIDKGATITSSTCAIEAATRPQHSLARKWKKVVQSQIINKHKNAKIAPSPADKKEFIARKDGSPERKWKKLVQSQIISKHKNSKIVPSPIHAIEGTIGSTDSLTRKWKEIVQSKIISRGENAGIIPFSRDTMAVVTSREDSAEKRWKSIIQSQIIHKHKDDTRRSSDYEKKLKEKQEYSPKSIWKEIVLSKIIQNSTGLRPSSDFEKQAMEEIKYTATNKWKKIIQAKVIHKEKISRLKEPQDIERSRYTGKERWKHIVQSKVIPKYK